MPWPSLCEEVAKLRIERRIGTVLSIPLAAQVGEKTRSSVTAGVTVSRSPTAIGRIQVEAAGIEPGLKHTANHARARALYWISFVPEAIRD